MWLRLHSKKKTKKKPTKDKYQDWSSTILLWKYGNVDVNLEIIIPPNLSHCFVFGMPGLEDDHKEQWNVMSNRNRLFSLVDWGTQKDKYWSTTRPLVNAIYFLSSLCRGGRSTRSNTPLENLCLVMSPSSHGISKSYKALICPGFSQKMGTRHGSYILRPCAGSGLLLCALFLSG